MNAGCCVLVVTAIGCGGDGDTQPQPGTFQAPCSSMELCDAPLTCQDATCQGPGALYGQVDVTSVSVVDVELPNVLTFTLTADADPIVHCGAGYVLAEVPVTEWPVTYVVSGLPPGSWLLRVYAPSVEVDRVASDEVAIEVDDLGRLTVLEYGNTAEWNFIVYGGTVYDCPS